MASLQNIFGGAWTPPVERLPDPPEVQLQDAIRAAGLEPPEHIYIDGKVHRFQSGSKGRPGNDKPGWYVAFADGVPAGRFGCWRSGIEVSWKANIGRELSAAENMAMARRMAEAAAARDEERKRTQESAAETVAAIWENCMGASVDHPYLQRKGVQPMGARVTGDGRLVVPLYSNDGEITSLQYISHDGGKMYHPGGKTGGCFWMVGSFDTAGPIYIAEGFATAATIHEATKRPCVVAYSASNLVPVTGAWRDRCGAMQELVVVADNDASGTGQKYADQCAAKYGARVVMPPEVGQDVNDYAQAGGDVATLLAPAIPSEDWLLPADEFSAQPAPVKWILKGWLQEKSLIMIHGPSGGGKTFVLLEWLLSVAAGFTQWQGRRVKPGPVVYLAGEGHEGLRGRVAGWKAARNASKLNMWISKSGCDLNTQPGYAQAAGEVKRLGIQPSIIAVDTLHRFLAGDENKAQDAKTMLDACGLLMREFGCAVILVHHTGVSEEAQHRARGSSAWRGALEVEISVVPGKEGEPMEICQRKSKDAELAEPIYARLISHPIPGWLDEDGEQVTTAIVEICDAAEAPAAPKKDSTTAANMKIFDRAWYASGAEIRQGAPYVTRAALRSFMTESLAYSDTKARKHAEGTEPGCMVFDLVLAGILDHFEHGFLVKDQVFASSLMIAKIAKN